MRQVIISVEDQQYTINSKMIHGEAFDMLGKRTKSILPPFTTAFENVRTHATANSIAEWKFRISSLTQETAIVAEQEMKQSVELDKVMNRTSGKTYITFCSHCHQCSCIYCDGSRWCRFHEPRTTRHL